MIENYLEIQRSQNWPIDEEESPWVRLSVQRAKMLAHFLIQFSKSSVPRILDAGCRTAKSMQAFKQIFPSAICEGVELVPEAAQECNLDGLPTQCSDIHDLSKFYDDKEFDWVFASHVLEHCHDIKLALSELQRVSKSGLFIVLPLENEESFKKNTSHYFYSSDALQWIDRLRTPGWQLIFLQVYTSSSDVVMVWRRSES